MLYFFIESIKVHHEDYTKNKSELGFETCKRVISLFSRNSKQNISQTLII